MSEKNFVERPTSTYADDWREGLDCCPSTARLFRCTRAFGHEMPHQASGLRNQVYAEWEDS